MFIEFGRVSTHTERKNRAHACALEFQSMMRDGKMRYVPDDVPPAIIPKIE
jgi:hypothetical protein